MKFLFCNNYFYFRGGSERVFLGEIDLLRSHGSEISILSQNYPEDISSQYSELSIKLLDNNYRQADLRKYFRIIKNKEAANQAKKLITEFKPDIIHAHNIYGGLTTSVLGAAAKLGVPSVLTLHDYKLICPSYLMLNKGQICEACKGRNYIRCLKNGCHKNSVLASAVYTMESYYNKWFKKWEQVKCYLCPSKFILEKMQENGFAAEKLVYIPNFVDPNQYQVNYDDSEYVLYAGRLSHEKGVLTLVKAMADLDIPLKIVGDGPVKEQIQSFIVNNKIERIELLGYKAGGELASLYQGAAFVAVPSEWYENAPMSILESYAYGKPVLGADIGGIPEMIDDCMTGMLFDSGDIVSLKDKCSLMWSDKQKMVEYGKAARRKLEDNYSSGTHFEKLIDVYRRAMK